MFIKLFSESARLFCCALRSPLAHGQFSLQSPTVCGVSPILKKTQKKGTMCCLLHKSPKFFNNLFLFVVLTTLGTFVNLFCLVYQVECSIVVYKSGNFEYHHCTLYIDYRQLFYPFRSRQSPVSSILKGLSKHLSTQ